MPELNSNLTDWRPGSENTSQNQDGTAVHESAASVNTAEARLPALGEDSGIEIGAILKGIGEQKTPQISAETFAKLKDADLINVIANEEYASAQKSLDAIETLTNERHTTLQTLHQQKATVDKLSSVLDFYPYRLLKTLFFGSEQFKDELLTLTFEKEKLAITQKLLSTQKESIKALSARKEELSEYSATSFGYCCLTEQGKTLAEQINAAPLNYIDFNCEQLLKYQAGFEKLKSDWDKVYDLTEADSLQSAQIATAALISKRPVEELIANFKKAYAIDGLDEQAATIIVCDQARTGKDFRSYLRTWALAYEVQNMDYDATGAAYLACAAQHDGQSIKTVIKQFEDCYERENCDERDSAILTHAAVTYGLSLEELLDTWESANLQSGLDSGCRAALLAVASVKYKLPIEDLCSSFAEANSDNFTADTSTAISIASVAHKATTESVCERLNELIEDEDSCNTILAYLASKLPNTLHETLDADCQNLKQHAKDSDHEQDIGQAYLACATNFVLKPQVLSSAENSLEQNYAPTNESFNRVELYARILAEEELQD